MPVLLEVRHITLEFSDLATRLPIARPPRPSPRAPGVHQSDILSHIAHKIGVLKPGQRFEEEDVTVYPWRWALGVMWEEFYFSLRDANATWQPGELTRDGISLNPDGVGVYGQWAAMVETKCTEKKVRDGADFLLEWLYRHQGANYCHAYGLELGERIEVVRYPVLFYRGDWRGSGPAAVEYTVRFAPAELKQSWNMLLVNKQATERELASASVSSVNVVNTEPKLIA